MNRAYCPVRLSRALNQGRNSSSPDLPRFVQNDFSSEAKPMLSMLRSTETSSMPNSCPTFEKINGALLRLRFTPSNPFSATSSINSCYLYRSATESIFITPQGLGEWEIAANSARTAQMLGEELSRLGLRCTLMGTSVAVDSRAGKGADLIVSGVVVICTARRRGTLLREKAVVVTVIRVARRCIAFVRGIGYELAEGALRLAFVDWPEQAVVQADGATEALRVFED